MSTDTVTEGIDGPDLRLQPLVQTGVGLSTVWKNSLLEKLFGPRKEKLGGGVFKRVSQTD